MLSKREREFIKLVLESEFWGDLIDKIRENWGYEERIALSSTDYRIEGYIRRLIHTIRKKYEIAKEEIKLIEEFFDKLEYLGYMLRR